MAEEQKDKQNLSDLTGEEYEKLLKLAYLGNWMVNAIRYPDEEVAEYRNVESRLLAQAENFGLDGYAQLQEDTGLYYASDKLSEDPEVQRMRDEYDDEVFWGELIIRLTRRDFIRKYGREKIEKMPPEERLEKEMEIEQKYWREFQKHGLDRLGVKK